MLSIEQIKYFLAIVEYGSLNKASQYLFISQPALTKQLSLLEKSLGCSLLLRTPTGIKLTPAGRYFYERCNLIMETINETIKQIKSFDKENVIRIGGLPNLITYFLPKYIEKLKMMNYEVYIEAMHTNSQLINSVRNGFLNIAFVSDAVQDSDIAIVPLVVEPFFVVMSASHPMVKTEEIDFLSVVKEKLILYKAPCPIRAAIRNHCSLMGVTPNITLELELTESLINYVEKGFGITIVPKMVADSMSSQGVIAREIKKFPLHRVVSAVLKKDCVSSYKSLLFDI